MDSVIPEFRRQKTEGRQEASAGNGHPIAATMIDGGFGGFEVRSLGFVLFRGQDTQKPPPIIDRWLAIHLFAG